LRLLQRSSSIIWREGEHCLRPHNYRDILWGYKTSFFGMNRFLEKITQAKLDGTYIKLLNQVDKADLIILDDFGLHPMETTSRIALLQIFEDGNKRKSMIIASQLPILCWLNYIGEAHLLMPYLTA